MAVRSQSLRPEMRRTGSESHVSFDEESGIVVRRSRLYDDGELASESFVGYRAETDPE